MADGVTLMDPATTYIDAGVRIGRDTVIHPLTFLEGSTRIGQGCEVGPSTRIVDSRLDDGATVQFSVVRGARVRRGATVGPFAHDPARDRPGRGREGRHVRRDQGLADRPRRQGAAPVLRRGRDGRRGHERRGRRR